jgi:hypothetical protein
MKIAAILAGAAVIGAGSVVIYHRLTSGSRNPAPPPGPGVEPEHTTAHTHA